LPESWATNAPELYLLLVRERGWSPERVEAWLADAWRRLLLRDPGQGAGVPSGAVPD
jgi:hypothetical protein